MRSEHRQCHILDHPGDQPGFDHPHHRQPRRQAGEIELVHAGANREQQFQIGKPRHRLGQRPGRHEADVLRAPHVGPDAERQLWQPLGENPGPGGAASGLGFPFRLVYRSFDQIEFDTAKNDEVFELRGFDLAYVSRLFPGYVLEREDTPVLIRSADTKSSVRCWARCSWWSTLANAAPAA